MAGIDLMKTVGAKHFEEVPENSEQATFLTIDAGENDKQSVSQDIDFEEAEDVTPYLGVYDAIRTEVRKIEGYASEIEQCTEEYFRTATVRGHKQIMSKVDQIIVTSQTTTRSVKRKLKEQKAENDTFARKRPGSSVAQWRINQLNTLAKRFHVGATAFQEALGEYRDTLRDSQKRQIKIIDVDCQLQDDDIDMLTQDYEQAQKFIHANLKMEVQGEFLEHLSDMEERLEGMQRIERSVRELQTMWQELHVLIDVQQELLDNIEHNVEKTKVYVSSGHQQVRIAEEHQRCARKQLWYCLCCAVISIGVVIFLFFGRTVQTSR